MKVQIEKGNKSQYKKREIKVQKKRDMYKSPNRKGKSKSEQKRDIKIQIEMGNKSASRNSKEKSKKKREIKVKKDKSFISHY